MGAHDELGRGEAASAASSIYLRKKISICHIHQPLGEKKKPKTPSVPENPEAEVHSTISWHP